MYSRHSGADCVGGSYCRALLTCVHPPAHPHGSQEFTFPFEVVFATATSHDRHDTQVRTRAATPHQNLLCFCFAFLTCVHLAGLSTICREEQQPHCRVTFYSTSPGSGTAAPLFALVLSIPASLVLPTLVSKLLTHRISAASNNKSVATRVPGAAAWFLPYVLRPELVGGNLYWILEWADSGIVFGEVWCPTLRLARTWVARLAFGTTLIGTAAVLCVCGMQQAVAEQPRPQSELGYMIVMSNYLCIFLAIFSTIYIPSQLTGQFVLCLTLVALLLYLEIIHSSTVSAEPGKEQRRPTLSDIVVLQLLAILAFYGTGHQATLASLQLKSAFLVHPIVVYPYSRVTLVLNSLGPFICVGFAAPLLAIWAYGEVRRVQRVRVVILLIHYCSTLLCASMTGAILFTSHPLVWKVTAPRYLLSAMVFVIFGLTGGVGSMLLHWISGRVI